MKSLILTATALIFAGFFLAALPAAASLPRVFAYYWYW